MADGFSRELVEAFADLSRALFDGSDANALLEHLVGRATTIVEGCDFASVSMRGPSGRLSTPAASDPLVVELDEVQYATGEGPCVEAVTTTAPAVYSAEVATDERWPTFGPNAAARGIGSLISYKIAADETLGALNLYGRRPRAFDDGGRDAASLLAIFASVVLASTHARLQAVQLNQALESRDVIGQAKGILMERNRVTADEAFDMLRRASQQVNRKLRDLAEDIASTGEEPPNLC
jgi:hypothetical protein